MGPRPGSPAAETRRERKLHALRFLREAGRGQFFWSGVALLATAVGFGGMFLPAGRAAAETARASTTLTIVVSGPELAFEEEPRRPETDSESGTIASRYRIRKSADSSGMTNEIVFPPIQESTEDYRMSAQTGALQPEASSEHLSGTLPVTWQIQPDSRSESRETGVLYGIVTIKD